MIKTLQIGKLLYKNACLFLSLFVFFSCQKTKPKSINPAFYYWKSSFNLTEKERNVLKTNQINKIYVNFFDIIWDTQTSHPQIVAPLRGANNTQNPCEIIPVVFITNQTFINIPASEIDTFARKVFVAMTKISKQKIKEIQIDCDWTLSTKQKYFHFLKAIKTDKIALSATVRLHQVKFFEKTGIPPVDRGMLMCYNMSDWQNIKTQNSIYSTKVLNQYIQRLVQYPIPLDVVMPIFHWTIVFRNNRFLFFINNLDSETLKNNSNFTKLSDNQRFEVKKDTLFNNFSIRKGDVFKCEASNFDEVLKGSEMILEKISNEKLTFALYHLDEKCLNKYSNDQIQQLLHINETLH